MKLKSENTAIKKHFISQNKLRSNVLSSFIILIGCFKRKVSKNISLTLRSPVQIFMFSGIQNQSTENKIAKNQSEKHSEIKKRSILWNYFENE